MISSHHSAARKILDFSRFVDNLHRNNKIMKVLLIAVAFAVTSVLAQKYTEKYDNLDLDEILGNRRLLMSYVKCVLEQGKCTPEGKELKEHISEALRNGCAQCTKNQRAGARRVIGHLIKNEPEYWKQLVEKYDPKKVYSTKYEKELNKMV